MFAPFFMHLKPTGVLVHWYPIVSCVFQHACIRMQLKLTSYKYPFYMELGEAVHSESVAFHEEKSGKLLTRKTTVLLRKLGKRQTLITNIVQASYLKTQYQP